MSCGEEDCVEAILLVGGLGTRLRPLTDRLPKPLLPVAGVPFIAHQVAMLAATGVEHVVLATSYRAEVFATVLGDGSNLGVELEYVDEEQPLGTGGAIRNAASRLRASGEDPVVVANGDILDAHDLSAQLDRHARHRADLTLYLTRVEDPRAYGCVPTDGDGRVTAFLEKTPDPPTRQVNAGCYVFRRAVLEEIPTGRVVSVERETFPGMLAAGRLVLGYVDDAYWLDLGTPAAYVRGSADLVLGRIDSPARPGPVGEALVLPGAQISPDAVVSGGTTVGRTAVVRAGARIEGSVLLDGAVVGEGSTVRGSVLGRGASLGAGCDVDDAVLGDGARVGDRNELRRGARVWTDAVLPAGAVRFSGG